MQKLRQQLLSLFKLFFTSWVWFCFLPHFADMKMIQSFLRRILNESYLVFLSSCVRELVNFYFSSPNDDRKKGKMMWATDFIFLLLFDGEICIQALFLSTSSSFAFIRLLSWYNTFETFLLLLLFPRDHLHLAAVENAKQPAAAFAKEKKVEENWTWKQLLLSFFLSFFFHLLIHGRSRHSQSSLKNSLLVFNFTFWHILDLTRFLSSLQNSFTDKSAFVAEAAADWACSPPRRGASSSSSIRSWTSWGSRGRCTRLGRAVAAVVAARCWARRWYWQCG